MREPTMADLLALIDGAITRCDDPWRVENFSIALHRGGSQKMKHWDLTPGETVTLRHASGRTVTGRFVSRDTRFACLQIDGIRRYFRTRPDGDLADDFLGRRVWQIEGEDRQTRSVL